MSVAVLAGSQVLSTYTGDQFITRVRSALNESTAAFWSDTELLRWINDGCKDIAAKALCLGTTEDVTVAVSTVEYTLASTDYLAAVAAVYNSTKALLPGSPNMVGRVPDHGEPEYWYLWDGKVGIYPVPSSSTASPVGKTVTVYFAQLPTVISDSGMDTIPVPVIYERALSDYVVAQALYKDEQPQRAGDYMARYDVSVDRYRQDFEEPSGRGEG